MIVAPLMLPIMGLAFSISVADVRSIVSSLLVSLGGIATAIAVGWLLAHLLLSSFDPTSNTQIMTRTAPRLVDLMAALATGLAGAFAMEREDVSDTLPGVAITISLVPPLANVGILLANGYPSLAAGSMLLFVTNYSAILLTGAFMFGLMAALSPRARDGRSAPGGSPAVAIAMVIVVASPLATTSYGVYKDNVAQDRAASATKQWLQGSGYRYVSAQVQQNATLRVVATGGGTLPGKDVLRALLAGHVPVSQCTSTPCRPTRSNSPPTEPRTGRHRASASPRGQLGYRPASRRASAVALIDVASRMSSPTLVIRVFR